MEQSWFPVIAALVSNSSAEVSARALAALAGLAVSHEGTCLIAFHGERTPEILHHTLEPAGAAHYLDRYLAGPYLLDPLFELSRQPIKPGFCRYRDAAPDRFRASEYYRQYCEQTHLRDEVDFLVDMGAGTTVVLVVGRRTRRFSPLEVQRLKDLTDTAHAAIRNVWSHHVQRRDGEEAARDTHLRLTRCFDRFGADVLTQRERQITQLLLRGHSSKSVARELAIAPSTVMVHKRNVFAKLGITSQYALFSRFIDELTKL